MILDNLKVHKTEEVFKFLKQNNLCTVFNAPYMSIFNSIEISFRSIKKVVYSNIYNSIKGVIEDVIKYLESNELEKTLLYNFGETISQYLLYSEKNISLNLNNLNIKELE